MGSGSLPEGSVVDGKYRVGRVLGRGGMGVVCEVTRVGLGSRFAMKLLHAESGELERSRFEREAIAASALQSRHVVRVIDIGDTDGAPYMIMELLRGQDLLQIYRGCGVLPISRVVDWMLQLCSAMHEAHAAGIVHRDLKPSNLFVLEGSDPEFVKVLDFGVSKVLAAASELTQQRALVGTPQYMAPEQLQVGVPIDHRADLWAMGVILYRLLARAHPFGELENRPPIAVAMASLTAPLLPIQSVRPDLPEGLVRTIEHALARDPQDRVQSARDLAIALAPYGSGRVHFEEIASDEAMPVLASLRQSPSSSGEAPPASAQPTESTTEIYTGATEPFVRPLAAVRPRRWRLGLLAAAALLAAGVAGAMLARPSAPADPADWATLEPAASSTTAAPSGAPPPATAAKAEASIEAADAPAPSARTTPQAAPRTPQKRRAPNYL